MLCDLCKKNPATVHLTQMVENKTKKVDLCENCSKEKGIDDPAGFSLADILLGLGNAQETATSALDAGLRCPNCGFTHADFKKAGRLGCSECYETFREGLDSILRNMHKGVRHVGKTPRRARPEEERTERLQALQERLDKAVASEAFEQAAVIRDEIKKLKDSQPPSAAESRPS